MKNKIKSSNTIYSNSINYNVGISSHRFSDMEINFNALFKIIIVVMTILIIIKEYDLSLYIEKCLKTTLTSSITSLHPIIMSTKAAGCEGIVDNGAYFSDVCADGAYFSYSASVNRCNDRFTGSDWHLATISNKQMNNKVSDAAILFSDSWLGGENTESSGVWRWKYGPLAGVEFYSGFENAGGAVNNRFFDWYVGWFNTKYPLNNGNPFIFRKTLGGTWENGATDKECGIICEKVYYKCFKEGTSTSNYIDKRKITCNCKDRYTGTLCDTIAKVVDGEYHYTYTAFCGVERNWEETKLFISYKNYTWAQPNSPVQFEAVKRLTKKNTAWLPARYNESESQWQWTEGPLRNKNLNLSGLLPIGSPNVYLYINNDGAFFANTGNELKKCVVWQSSRYVPTTTTAATTTNAATTTTSPPVTTTLSTTAPTTVTNTIPLISTSTKIPSTISPTTSVITFPLTTTIFNKSTLLPTTFTKNYTFTNIKNVTTMTSSSVYSITNTNSSYNITNKSIVVLTSSTTNINIVTTSNGSDAPRGSTPFLSPACNKISNSVRIAAVVMSCIVTIFALVIGIPSIVAQVQGVAALGMLSSSWDFSAEAFGSSYRALSPFALSESYIGVVGGNMVVITLVAIVQLIVLFAIKKFVSLKGWTTSMAMVRFPSISLTCVFALYCGTSFAASQMVSLPDRSITDRVVGALVLVLFLLIPIGLVLLTRFFIGRAYFKLDMYTWLRNNNLPSFLELIVYPGTIFGLDLREAYGPLIRYRLKHCIWASYLTWSPLVVSIAGIFQPHNRVGRAALLIVFGIGSIAIGVLVAFMRPHRVQIVSVVEAVAHTLLGVAFIIAGIGNAASVCVSIPIAVIGFFIILLFFMRIIHAILAYVIERKVLSENIIQKTLLWTTFDDKDNQTFNIDSICFKDDPFVKIDESSSMGDTNSINHELICDFISDSCEKSLSLRPSNL